MAESIAVDRWKQAVVLKWHAIPLDISDHNIGKSSSSSSPSESHSRRGSSCRSSRVTTANSTPPYISQVCCRGCPVIDLATRCGGDPVDDAVNYLEVG